MLRKIFSLAIASALLLGGCRSESPVDYPPLSFTRYQPIYLNVATIEIVEEYKPPMRIPNVEHLLPYSPAEAMRIWVRDRLRAAGSDKILQVIVKDGSVKVTALPTPGGLKGLFTISQDRRYDAALSVELRIYGGGALSEASVAVQGTRSVTMREDASVAERDATFRRMIAELMEPLNAELEKNMFMYMGNHINYSLNP